MFCRKKFCHLGQTGQYKFGWSLAQTHLLCCYLRVHRARASPRVLTPDLNFMVACFVSVWHSPGQDRALVLDQDRWGKNYAYRGSPTYTTSTNADSTYVLFMLCFSLAFARKRPGIGFWARPLREKLLQGVPHLHDFHKRRSHLHNIFVLFQFGIRQDKTGHWFWIKTAEGKIYSINLLFRQYVEKCCKHKSISGLQTEEIQNTN